MIRVGLCLFMVISLFSAPAGMFQQAGQSDLRPSFAGTWTPSDPERTDVLFKNGLGWIPSDGRLVIEQRSDRFTLTKEVPDEKLDPILDINGQYIKTMVFRIVVPRGRAGGAGAAGDQRPSSWQGDRLTFHDSPPGGRPFTMTFSLEGERLKLETRAVMSPGRENNIVNWFTKVK